MKSTRYAWQAWKLINLLVVGLLACQPVAGWAQVSYFWNAGPGTADWGTPANWDPPGPPVATDSAILYVSDNSTKIADYNNSLPAAPLLGGVYINSGPTGSMTLLLRRNGLAGELQANEVSVGDKSLGILEQQAGLLEVPGYLYVGNPVGSTGTYNLSGGTLDTANSLVGNRGTGIFNQNGGTHNVSNELNLGQEAGSTGTYTLENGEVKPNLLFVGYNGRGTFNQNGGIVTITDHLGVGRENGSIGEYNLDGGTFTTQDLYVGWKGQGVFNKGAGALNVKGCIFLATGETGATTGRGTFNLNRGSLAVANLDVGLHGIGEFYQASGTALTIGDDNTDSVLGVNSQVGISTFTQDGGDTTVYGNIRVGREPGSQGHYYLNNGTLTIHDSPGLLAAAFVGDEGTGFFTQSGGTHSIVSGHLNLGDSRGGQGTYNLEDGTLHTWETYVGDDGTGFLNQNGGNHLINHELWVGRRAGSNGTYNLNSGTLTITPPSGTISSIFLGVGGTGTFNQEGGTVNLAGGTLQMGVETGGVGTYNLNSGQLQVGTLDLAVTGPATPGRGIFNLAGGTLTAGVINLNPGGTFNQTGGEVSFIDTPGNGLQVRAGGIFNQTGGIVEGANNTIVINEGTYNLYSSTLKPGCSLIVRPGGVFNQTFGLVDGFGNNTSILIEGQYNCEEGYIRPAQEMEISPGGTFNLTRGNLNLRQLNAVFLIAGTCTISNGTVYLGPSMAVLPGGVFNQTTGSLAGNSNSTILIEGQCNLQWVPVSNYRELKIGPGGTFNHYGNDLATDYQADLSIEGTCNLGYGKYHFRDIHIYTGGSLNLSDGFDEWWFDYDALSFRGGSFTGNLTNRGFLSGNGTLTGNITNLGTVNPGDSPGTLSVVGSFTQKAGGEFVCDIASATDYDRIVVTGTPGTATLDGALVANLEVGFQPARGQLFPGIISATGGITGEFDEIELPLRWRVLYHPTSVDLMADPFRDFTDPALRLSPNQLRVGEMLNGLRDTAQGDLEDVLMALSDLPDQQVPQGLQQVAPDQNASLANLSVATSLMQGRSLIDRMNVLRQGEGTATGGSLGGRPSLMGSRLQGIMLAYNGATLGDLFTGRARAAQSQPWGLFANFVGTLGSQDTTSRQTGYTYGTVGFTSGIDYRFRPDLILGFGTGYYHTDSSFKNDRGDATVNSIPFYVYGLYHPGNFYLTGSVGYTLNLYDLKRSVAFGAIQRTAASSFTGNQLNMAWESGYDLKLSGLRFTPAANLFYTKVWLPAYTETGASALDLRVGAQTADSVQTGLGARLAYPWKSGQTRITPEFSAFYQHEFANSSRNLNARLSQSGGAFTFQTNDPARNFAVLGASLVVQCRDNLFLQASYNAEVGRQHTTAHYLNAGLRWQF